MKCVTDCATAVLVFPSNTGQRTKCNIPNFNKSIKKIQHGPCKFGVWSRIQEVLASSCVSMTVVPTLCGAEQNLPVRTHTASSGKPQWQKEDYSLWKRKAQVQRFNVQNNIKTASRVIIAWGARSGSSCCLDESPLRREAVW